MTLQKNVECAIGLAFLRWNSEQSNGVPCRGIATTMHVCEKTVCVGNEASVVQSLSQHLENI